MTLKKSLETAARMAAYAALGSAGSAVAWLAVDAVVNGARTRGSGQLNFLADTSAQGRPLLLVPGSRLEQLFERYRGTRPVYALDDPRDPGGILRMIDEAISGEHPVDVIASGGSAEAAARAALESPHSIRSLTLVSPTGMTRLREVYGALQMPVLALGGPAQEMEPFVRNHMNWVAVRMHGWKHLSDVAAALDYFWKDTVPVIGAAMGLDTERTSACSTVRTPSPVS